MKLHHPFRIGIGVAALAVTAALAAASLLMMVPIGIPNAVAASA